MNSVVRNFLVVLGGLIVGAIINSGIIQISASLIPLPEGIDPNNMDDLMMHMKDFPPKNFIMPFLAHALGTLVGAYFVSRFAASHHLKLSLLIGLIFLAGGISMVLALPSPIWFNVIDLLLAFIPMAYIGWKLAGAPST
jgi:hypothetical protein